MSWNLYVLIVLAIPSIFCIWIYNLRKSLKDGKMIAYSLIGIIAGCSLITIPLQMMGVVVSDTSYEFFNTCIRLLLYQIYYYSIIIMCLYIAIYIGMRKSKRFIILMIVLAIIIVLLIAFLGNFLFKERQNPDALYLKMKQYDIDSNLIGLSSEEVVILLGEPSDITEYKDKILYYSYDAGIVYEGIIWGNQNIFTTKHYYSFSIDFDENGKVESTSIREVV